MAKQVKFVKVYPPYNAGETAEFADDNVAQRLVAEGVATAVGFAADAALGTSVLNKLKAGDSGALAANRAAGFGRGKG